jgi:16S rRNA A1518/A1519 N6-dimethyltransferase RsmA/KsgA/DIM1 with predicted DNA glycosylase/AP lyase activity
VIVEDPDNREPAAFASAGVSWSGRRVLEIGCGDGRITKQYAHLAASVLAIDPDADAVVKLTQRLPTVDARPLAIDALSLPPHSVDLILFAWSL